VFYGICRCLKSEYDFYIALFNYGLALKKENVVYAEIHFSPWRHLSRNIQLNTVYKGLAKAISELELYHNMHIRLICDIVRNPNEEINSIIEWILRDTNHFIVGIGISGGTGALPRINYQNVCYKIKQNGHKITVHAGELEPPDSILEAIDYLYADRIGHGITLIQTPDLFKKIAHKEIHFELCPTANDVIGLGKPNFQSIKQMIKLVKDCSINTDDELIFQTNLTQEFSVLIKNDVITVADIACLQSNAKKASFAEYELKKKLFCNTINSCFPLIS
jgi:adenosine deaminase